MESTVRLTGQFSFKQSLLGRLVLYVEEEREPIWPWARTAPRRRWRKARVMDLTTQELRALLDLGRRPHDGGARGYGRPFVIPPLPRESTDAAGRPATVDGPRSVALTQAA